MKPTFANLIAATADQAQWSRERTRSVVETFIGQLADAVWAHGRVVVPGLGMFQVRSRRPRKGVNPHTNEPIAMPARRSVYARVAKSWRRRG